MSKDHLSRKQMKTDEIQVAIAGAEKYIAGHKDETKRYGAMALGAIVLVALVWWGISYRSSRLDGRLSDALGVFNAPILAEGEKPSGNQPAFKSAAERTAAVEKELKALATDSPGSSAGKAASMMLMSLAGQKEVTPDRVDRVVSFASSRKGTLTGGFAAAAAIEAKASEGKIKEAIELAKDYLDSSSAPLPKDVVMFMLGDLYEKNGQTTEARTLYQRLISEFPRSAMRNEAQQRVSSL